MTERNFIDKNGNSWTWEETSDTIEALKRLHNDMREDHERTKLATPLKERPKVPSKTTGTAGEA